MIKMTEEIADKAARKILEQLPGINYEVIKSIIYRDISMYVNKDSDIRVTFYLSVPISEVL